MENVFFSFIINDTDRLFSIIGALSEEEEINLVTQISKIKGISLRRQSFNMKASIQSEIDAMKNILEGYKLVELNAVILNRKFIDL